MYSEQRQSLILDQLEVEGKVDVAALAEYFAISRETIRRDLRDMEKSGLLIRTHGGALPAGKKFSDGYEYPLLVRSVQKYEEKQRICIAAAKLLKDGDTIYIDNSSTTMHLIKYVPKDKKITVITNSIQVLLEAGKKNDNNIVVISIGGVFNEKNYSLVGTLSSSYAQVFFPDKAIISCRGIDEQNGLTDSGFPEIEVKQRMITNSKETILLADYTKFGASGAFFICGLEQINVVLTDPKVNQEKLNIFKDFDTRIIIAD